LVLSSPCVVTWHIRHNVRGDVPTTRRPLVSLQPEGDTLSLPVVGLSSGIERLNLSKDAHFRRTLPAQVVAGVQLSDRRVGLIY
jgi:hypothetical protein